MKFLDPAGDGAYLVNPRHLKSIRVESIRGGARMGLILTYPSGEQETFLLSADRYSVLEPRLQELTGEVVA